MNAHHLHTCIEEEDAAGQDDVVKLGEVGEEALRHVHVVRAAGSYVYDTKYDQKSCWDDGADKAAPFADLSDPVETFECDYRRHPVYGQYRHERIDPVRGEYGIMGVVHADERE